MNRRPLEGTRVIDFSWALVGPITGKSLADYGAEVIKIEGRTRIDQQRTSGFFKDRILPSSVNCGSNFNMINTSKLSVALNLAKPRGIEVARKFVRWADVVIENFAGGIIDKMGLGYEELKKIKPDIIMLSSCMMGQTGPHAWLGGIGTQLAALGGINHITGWPDREPQAVGPYTDFVAPHFNVFAILAALDYRRRTGKGQYIDMSQYENSIHLVAPLILDYQVNRRMANRMGNSLATACPHGVYRCFGNERWCAIAVFTQEEWGRFCRVLDRGFWTSDSRFGTLEGRKENEDELNTLVNEWTIHHSPEDVMVMMQTAGIAAGVVETAEDLLEHDLQLRHRGFFVRLRHPEVGEYRSPRHSFILSKSSCEMKRAPLLGEHNEYALKRVLDLSDEEIAELIIEGVVE